MKHRCYCWLLAIVDFAKTMKMNRKSSHYGLHFGKGITCEKGDKCVFKGVKNSNEYSVYSKQESG